MSDPLLNHGKIILRMMELIKNDMRDDIFLELKEILLGDDKSIIKKLGRIFDISKYSKFIVSLLDKGAFYILLNMLIYNNTYKNTYNGAIIDDIVKFIKNNNIPNKQLLKIQKLFHNIDERHLFCASDMCTIYNACFKKTKKIYPITAVEHYRDYILHRVNEYSDYIPNSKVIDHIIDSIDKFLKNRTENERDLPINYVTSFNIRIIKMILRRDKRGIFKNYLNLTCAIELDKACTRMHILIFIKILNKKYIIYTGNGISGDHEHMDVFENVIICAPLDKTLQLMARKTNDNINIIGKKEIISRLYRSMQYFTTRNITKSILYYV
jgi:hypothetical protein